MVGAADRFIGWGTRVLANQGREAAKVKLYAIEEAFRLFDEAKKVKDRKQRKHLRHNFATVILERLPRQVAKFTYKGITVSRPKEFSSIVGEERLRWRKDDVRMYAAGLAGKYNLRWPRYKDS